jgi:murein DD-endopeptidase MepM/ murein hydrolase activator NlpD
MCAAALVRGRLVDTSDDVRASAAGIARPDGARQSPAPAAGDASETVRVERAAVGRRGTLSATLEKLGVDGTLRADVLDAIARHVDMTRLSPRTGVTVSFASAGTPRQVAVRAEPERYVRVRLDRGGAAVLGSELIRLPVVGTVERAGGIVRTSVAQALAGSPHSLQLTLAYAAMFQWDVDLLIDPRPGDRIRIVYESLRLGDVPEDLPGFGSAPRSAGEFLRVGRILAASYDGAMARSTGFWVEGADGRGGHYDAEGRPLRKAFLKSPLNYRRISSGFSNARRNPVTRRVVPHHGVDFAAATGTPVVSTADGRVIFTGWAGPLGRAVRIRHGGSFVTVYGHLSGIASGIRNGAQVEQNQVIGYVGATGRATGPHLHYTLIREGRPINPLTFENPPAEGLPESELSHLAAVRRRWSPVLERIESDPRRLAVGAGSGGDTTHTGS